MVRFLTVPAEDELQENTHVLGMGLLAVFGHNMFFLFQAHCSHSSDCVTVSVPNYFLQRETKLYFDGIVCSLLHNVQAL